MTLRSLRCKPICAIDNPINRYAISSWMPLKRNQDGSIDHNMTDAAMGGVCVIFPALDQRLTRELSGMSIATDSGTRRTDLAMPNVVSTAVMTGNLTNTVLVTMNLLSTGRSAISQERTRLARSVWPLIGFLSGCAVAGAAVPRLADWAWIFPVVLAAVAVMLVTPASD